MRRKRKDRKVLKNIWRHHEINTSRESKGKREGNYKENVWFLEVLKKRIKLLGKWFSNEENLGGALLKLNFFLSTFQWATKHKKNFHFIFLCFFLPSYFFSLFSSLQNCWEPNMTNKKLSLLGGVKQPTLLKAQTYRI